MPFWHCCRRFVRMLRHMLMQDFTAIVSCTSTPCAFRHLPQQGKSLRTVSLSATIWSIPLASRAKSWDRGTTPTRGICDKERRWRRDAQIGRDLWMLHGQPCGASSFLMPACKRQQTITSRVPGSARSTFSLPAPRNRGSALLCKKVGVETVLRGLKKIIEPKHVLAPLRETVYEAAGPLQGIATTNDRKYQTANAKRESRRRQ